MKKTTIEIMREVLSVRKATDSGRLGDAFECGCRSFTAGRSVLRTKRQGQPDSYFTAHGKKYRLEYKSACGELDGTDTADFIVYCIEVDPDFPAEEQGYVFSREEWKVFISGYPGRGKFLKVDEKRGHIHIQSFRSEGRPKASQPIRDYIEEVCFNQPILSDWVEMMRE